MIVLSLRNPKIPKSHKSSKPTLSTFLNSKLRNVWLYWEGSFSIYVRKAQRLHPHRDGYIKVFDIATFDVDAFLNPMEGAAILVLYVRWIKYVEGEVRKRGYEGVYVENVIKKNFHKVYEDLGYERYPHINDVCFIKVFGA